MDLQNPYDYLCFEHLYYGSAFNDMYEWFFTRGKKTFPPLVYTNPRDIVDVTRNGIFFFLLCNGPTDSFTGSLETFNLFAGG